MININMYIDIHLYVINIETDVLLQVGVRIQISSDLCALVGSGSVSFFFPWRSDSDPDPAHGQLHPKQKP